MMNSTSHVRSGMSLVESMIAIGIFSMVMAMTMQSLIAAKDYDSLASQQDDINIESNRIMSMIREDMATSSWEFPDPTSLASLAGATADGDRSLIYYPYIQVQSPGPTSLENGRGSAFSWSHRSPALVLLGDRRESADKIPNIGGLGDTMLSAADMLAAAQARGEATGWSEDRYWGHSFFARSQEILFLKATSTSWNMRTESIVRSEQAPILTFGGVRSKWRETGTHHDELGVFHPSGWVARRDGENTIIGWDAREVPYVGGTANENPYGVVMETSFLGNPTSDLADIRMNWMTIDGKQFVDPRASVSETDENLKAYTYAVVPSPSGFGRLVRAYKVKLPSSARMANPAGGIPADLGTMISADEHFGMVVDRVLSENVMRVCFDSYRTVDKGSEAVSTLDINQIRVRLYFGAKAQNGTTVTRLFESIVTMRGRNSQTDKDFESANSIASSLGQKPVGLRK